MVRSLGSIVDEVRAIKKSLRQSFFAPAVLRRIVEFNIEVANHFESLLDAERAMDADVARSFDATWARDQR